MHARQCEFRVGSGDIHSWLMRPFYFERALTSQLDHVDNLFRVIAVASLSWAFNVATDNHGRDEERQPRYVLYC
jgi:hypothetical protein